MSTDRRYTEVVNLIRSLPEQKGKEDKDWVKRYLGTDKDYKCTKTGDLQKLAKDLLKKYVFTKEEIYEMTTLIYSKAKSFEEMAVAAYLVQYSKIVKDSFDVSYLDKWLDYTTGWAEIDTLCQSTFGAIDLSGNWDKWKELLVKFSKSKIIAKRRASLVLLTKSVRQSNDKKIFNLGIANVERLKDEKEILITKAISWLLRSMVKNFKEEVREYINRNLDSLPKIAIRETMKKIETGRK